MTTTASPTPIRDPWQRIWRALSGDRWLAVLVLALAALLLAAAFLPQTPQADPVAYSRWLSETQQRFGSLTPPFISLGLFSITHAIGFRLIAALVGLSCALRLIDQLDRWRALRRLPDRPIDPAFDRVAGLDRDAVRLTFRSDGEVIVADRYQRRSIVAAIMLYVGALMVLLGLVLGLFTDTRTDNITVEPGTVTAVPGTPYTLRLDALNDGRAAVAVLSEGQPIGQGELADRQPLIAAGVSIYLRDVGPALIITATRHSGEPLGLQSTVDSPPQPEKLLSFAPDRSESFVAAPDAKVVLQVTWLMADRYTAQVLQTATGKVLASREIVPGDTLGVDEVTFGFRPSAFVTVAVVQQPAHALIIPGWLLINLGVLGTLLWRSTRVWLEAQADQTRVVSDDAPLDRALVQLDGAQPIARLRPTGRRAIAALWLSWTGLMMVVAVSVYGRAASLEADDLRFTAWLAAWLLFTGSTLVRRRGWSIGLAVLGVVAVGVSIALGLD